MFFVTFVVQMRSASRAAMTRSWASPTVRAAATGPVAARTAVELAGVVRLLLDGGKEACPEPRLPPAIKTAGNGAPRAIPLRQITPGGAGAEEPQDTVEDASVIGGWTACMRFLRRKQGL